VAEGIAHAGGVRAVEHLRGRLNFLGARSDRALQDGRIVVHENVQAGSAASERTVVRRIACRQGRRS
jgi:hypothetical protein